MSKLVNKVPIGLLTYETLAAYVCNQGPFVERWTLEFPPTSDSMVLEDWVQENQLEQDFTGDANYQPNPDTTAYKWCHYLGGTRAHTYRIWMLLVQITDHLPDCPYPKRGPESGR